MKSNQTSKLTDQKIEHQTSVKFKANYRIMMKRGRSFLCSIDILEDKEVSPQAKILFQIISYLSINEGYCYASNEYLAQKMGVSVSTTKRYLIELQKLGLTGHDTSKNKDRYSREIHIQFKYIRNLYFKK